MTAVAINQVAPAARQPGVTITAGCRPLMDITTAAYALNWRMERVQYAVSLGKLPCFDIRSASADRTCLRLFAPSVRAVLQGAESQRAARTAEMLAIILPGRSETLVQSRVSWLLHCDVGHVVHLCCSGELSESGLRDARGARAISRQSIAAFLTERRVCL